MSGGDGAGDLSSEIGDVHDGCAVEEGVCAWAAGDFGEAGCVEVRWVVGDEEGEVLLWGVEGEDDLVGLKVTCACELSCPSSTFASELGRGLKGAFFVAFFGVGHAVGAEVEAVGEPEIEEGDGEGDGGEGEGEEDGKVAGCGEGFGGR